MHNNIHRFLPNKYTKWYYMIINKRKNISINGYVERHHIIPKSIGGYNSKENIVKLTAREHFICHLLLPKMLIGAERTKMLRAFHALVNLKSPYHMCYKITSRYFEKARIYNAIAQSTRIVTDDTRRKMSIASKRRTLLKRIKTGYVAPMPRSKRGSLEHRQKLSSAKLGKCRPSKVIEKMRPTMFKIGQLSHNKGKCMSLTQRQCLSQIKQAKATKYEVYDKTETLVGEMSLSKFCDKYGYKISNAYSSIKRTGKYFSWTFNVKNPQM